MNMQENYRLIEALESAGWTAQEIINLIKYVESGEAQYTQKYIWENLEEIKFRVRKGEKDRYRVAAEKAGVSMARFFLDAADEKIAREDLESSFPEPGINPGSGGTISEE